jgi:hypothetical protein
MWLNFAHLDKSSPRPGPCSNMRLIEWRENDSDADSDDDDAGVNGGVWIMRKNLSMANDLRGGDYRRVTEATWLKYVSLYPGSGPTITMIYSYDTKFHDSGYYPTNNGSFKILNPPPPPPLPLLKQGGKITKKKSTPAGVWSPISKKSLVPDVQPVDPSLLSAPEGGISEKVLNSDFVNERQMSINDSDTIRLLSDDELRIASSSQNLEEKDRLKSLSTNFKYL